MARNSWNTWVLLALAIIGAIGSPAAAGRPGPPEPQAPPPAATAAAECVQLKDADACLHRLADAAAVAASGSSRYDADGVGGVSAASNSGSGVPVLAIALPAAVGGALLLLAAAAATCCWCRSRRAPLPPLLPSSKDSCAASRDSSIDVTRDAQQAPADKCRAPLPAPLLLPGQRWRLVAQRCAGGVTQGEGAEPIARELRLGLVLGAGSFGRVYKARLREEAVAVKVLLHTRAQAKCIENEADLMLNFQHPNVLQALFYSVYERELLPTPQPCRRPSRGDSAHTSVDDSSGSAGAAAVSSDDHLRMRRFSCGDVASARSLGWLGAGSTALRSSFGNLSLSALAARGPFEAAGAPVLACTARPPHRAAESGGSSSSSSSSGGVGVGGSQASTVAAAGAATASGSISDVATAPRSLLPTQLSPLAAVSSFTQLPAMRRPDSWSPTAGNASSSAGGSACTKSTVSSSSGAAGGGSARVADSAAGAGGVSADEAGGDHHQEAQTWVVTEYCDGGTLADALADGRLCEPGERPSPLPALVWLHGIACGLSYLHSCKVLHGDLKCANVLLKRCPFSPGGYVAKVADFGLSRALEQGATHHNTQTLGTVPCMPPERLRSSQMTAAGDVYAFGIIMWEVASGQRAYEGMHFAEIIQRVLLNDERPPLHACSSCSDSSSSCGAAGWPPEFLELMQACWATQPTARPSFQAVRLSLERMLEGLGYAPVLPALSLLPPALLPLRQLELPQLRSPPLAAACASPEQPATLQVASAGFGRSAPLPPPPHWGQARQQATLLVPGHSPPGAEASVLVLGESPSPSPPLAMCGLQTPSSAHLSQSGWWCSCPAGVGPVPSLSSLTGLGRVPSVCDSGAQWQGLMPSQSTCTCSGVLLQLPLPEQPQAICGSPLVLRRWHFVQPPAEAVRAASPVAFDAAASGLLASVEVLEL